MKDPARSPSTTTAVVTAFLLYIVLCVFRIANALYIQTQFDPDEYWQILEPAYCEAFPERQCAYTWEWKRRAGDQGRWWTRSLEGPIRSYLSILPTYVFYVLAKRWKWDYVPWVIPRGPLLVHAVLVAAPTDLATWYMGGWTGISKDVKTRQKLSVCCLFCSITSWFNGYALIRTYSNSLEDMFLAVGIALVSPELFGNTTRRYPNLRTAVAFVLGGMSVAVRFTSLTAWIPVGILLAIQRPGLAHRISYLVMPCALFGIIGIGLSLIVDWYFYGFWTLPFLGSLHFNVILGLGTLYGAHAAHWYVSSGIPAITGTLLPFVLYDVWDLRKSPWASSQQKAWILIASYTILHSFSAHKEFRFLLPILPLLLCRAGNVIMNTIVTSRRRRRRQCVLAMMFLVLPNMIILCYLARFHQGAPIQINRRIRQLAQQGGKSHYSIHYLMTCHSTPLYSHLHVPSVKMEAWTLDCSPACRASSNVICESDRFAQEPVRFVKEAYGMDDDDDDCGNEEQQGTTTACAANKRLVPDFLAVFAENAASLKEQLAHMGLKQVDRFSQGINGAKVGPLQFGDDFSSDAFSHYHFFGMLEISVDEMVLFAKPELSL